MHLDCMICRRRILLQVRFSSSSNSKTAPWGPATFRLAAEHDADAVLADLVRERGEARARHRAEPDAVPAEGVRDGPRRGALLDVPRPKH